jgi:hypothetical protein
MVASGHDFTRKEIRKGFGEIMADRDNRLYGYRWVALAVGKNCDPCTLNKPAVKSASIP